MEYIDCIERDGSDFRLDRPVSDIAAVISARQPVIVRSLLSQDEVDQLRSHCEAWRTREAPSNPPVNRSSSNYHRVNVNVERSSVKSINHVFRFFYWDSRTDPLAPAFRRAMQLRNAISGLPMDFGQDDIAGGLISIPFVSHYPKGGGGMERHRDTDSEQKVVVIVALSRFGEDYTSGGLYYVDDANPDEQIHVDPFLRAGDAFLFHPQVVHGVDPVDPDHDLDWSRTDGRWIFMSSVTSVGSLNGSGYAGAGQPV